MTLAALMENIGLTRRTPAPIQLDADTDARQALLRRMNDPSQPIKRTAAPNRSAEANLFARRIARHNARIELTYDLASIELLERFLQTTVDPRQTYTDGEIVDLAGSWLGETLRIALGLRWMGGDSHLMFSKSDHVINPFEIMRDRWTAKPELTLPESIDIIQKTSQNVVA